MLVFGCCNYGSVIKRKCRLYIEPYIDSKITKRVKSNLEIKFELMFYSVIKRHSKTVAQHK